jgi:haloacid dehalogenase-like hydrolase
MKTRPLQKVLMSLLIFLWIMIGAVNGHANDPLPSWQDTAHKKTILSFVKAVSTEGTADYVPIEHRIATFDMDGTIFVEKPIVVNFAFMLNSIKAVGESNSLLREVQPYKAVLENDMAYIVASSNQVGLMADMGNTGEEYRKRALDFVKNNKHQRYDKPYFDLFYTPMIELIKYLQSNHFRVYIVSGSLQSFVRAVVKEKIKEIPHSNLIGTRVSLTYQTLDGKTAFSRNGDFLRPTPVAHEGKPFMIELNIGEKPILAFGNSSGDQHMFEYTATNERYRHLILCLLHDDAEREYVYSSGVKFEPDWLEISMKNDFGLIFDKNIEEPHN